MKGEINSNKIILEDFNTLLSSMDRLSSQNQEGNVGLDLYFRPNKPAIYRTFHPTAVEFTFFSSAHGTFSRTDRMLDHKTSLNLRRLKSYPASFLTTMIQN